MTKQNTNALYRWANTSKCSTDEIIALANDIETAGYTHHCPLSLGLVSSLECALVYYWSENLPQRVIATIYGVSQPTISRAINAVLDLLERFLPTAPTVEDLVPTRHRVLDGTLVPCWSWKGQQQLISGKRKATGHNLAVLTDQNGNIEYISPPMPGRSHDKRIADKLGITTVLPGDYVTADLGYVGTGFDIPQKRNNGQKVLEPWQQRFNNALASIRWVVEQAIAHIKNWRILHTDCRLPIATTKRTIQTLTKLFFYRNP